MNDLTIYDTLAESWWQAGSPLQLLARMHPARFVYFAPLVRHWQGAHVLDLGCGGGLATACLAQRGATVVGVDLSRASLRVASRHTAGSAILQRSLRVDGPKLSPLPERAWMSYGVPTGSIISPIVLQRSPRLPECSNQGPFLV